ncbi:pyruvate kinase [Rahnella aquatilis HX2]|nr:pyruvate kinase [Rahnella aquatilis HX2]
MLSGKHFSNPSQLVDKIVMKKTKIVCTIGPKTESEEMLTKLLDAGMNVMLKSTVSAFKISAT